MNMMLKRERARPDWRNFSVKVSAETHEKLRAVADDMEVGVSAIVRVAVKQYLADMEDDG